jgi:hypothetical protein
MQLTKGTVYFSWKTLQLVFIYHKKNIAQYKLGEHHIGIETYKLKLLLFLLRSCIVGMNNSFTSFVWKEFVS